ncbi:hypothetical protein OG739_22960 [Streptomyces longwoodensis]|uniref:hypothetical protein n=1 Tax=Streptomyces longwoodensis TaxID=68231 RepID=UPI0022557F18|nr:hypothetical protein [Streptomyces longwoodensis]MCX4995561.1 hypothetical protein [Streptomyces longwoodensis]WTI45375.1 hypothetical protein OG547_13090 [Streptomyces longwoodensis]WUC71669.1 hypothetical protein OG416_13105 [Streptomyces longwoodensis]
MVRHLSPQYSTGLRALAVLATAGVGLGAAAGAAAAADAGPRLGGMHTPPASLGQIDPQSGVQGLTDALPYATGALTNLKPNPLAGTGVDPLDNGVGTQIGDFRPLSSQMLTEPVAEAPSVGSMPLAGQATGLVGN